MEQLVKSISVIELKNMIDFLNSQETLNEEQINARNIINSEIMNRINNMGVY